MLGRQKIHPYTWAVFLDFYSHGRPHSGLDQRFPIASTWAAHRFNEPRFLEASAPMPCRPV